MISESELKFRELIGCKGYGGKVTIISSHGCWLEINPTGAKVSPDFDIEIMKVEFWPLIIKELFKFTGYNSYQDVTFAAGPCHIVNDPAEIIITSDKKAEFKNFIPSKKVVSVWSELAKIRPDISETI